MSPVRGTHCHIMVRSVAIELAGAVYDEVMRDNKVYEMWKEVYPALSGADMERAFIEMMWPKLIERARATLAGMLTGNYSSDLKDQIADALIADNQFRAERHAAEARWRKKYGFGLDMKKVN